MTKHLRDLVAGQLTLDYFMQRAAAGWTLAAVEWVREAEGEAEPDVSAKPAKRASSDEVPYGFRIAEGGLNLEQNPFETAVLLRILEDIVKEKRLTDIALDLNVHGHATREGASWTPTEVFNLLPRIVEIGPRLLKTAEWRARREDFTIQRH